MNSTYPNGARTWSASEILAAIRSGDLAYTIRKRNRKTVDIAVSIPGWPADCDTRIRVSTQDAEGL